MSPALPPAFVSRMRAQLGAEADAYFAALERPYLRGLRLNPQKPVSEAALEAVGGVEGPVPWNAALGHYLHQDSLAGSDPLHEAGAYYLQEPSAMAPAGALEVLPGERVLDLCAAPGGKSTQLAAAMGGRGVLVANEIHPGRARVLLENLERLGVENAVVLCEKPDRLLQHFGAWFDAVLFRRGALPPGGGGAAAVVARPGGGLRPAPGPDPLLRRRPGASGRAPGLFHLHL